MLDFFLIIHYESLLWSVYVCVYVEREGGVRGHVWGPAEKDSKRMLTSH